MHNPYNKVTQCLSVLKDLTESVWFSFTVSLFIGPEKVYNYWGEWYHHPPREMSVENPLPPKKYFF